MKKSLILKRFLISFICIFFSVASSLGQNADIDNNRICIDSLDFCIAGFSPQDDMVFYSSMHLDPSSVPYDTFIKGIDNDDWVFVLYDGSPEAYMTLGRSIKMKGVKRFRMVDYLQQISVYLYRNLNDEWRVLHYRDKACVTNNGNGVVEVVYNSRTGIWKDKSIYSFDWEKYREEIIPSSKELVRLCKESVAQYYLSAMIHKTIDALLLSSTTFSFFEPISRTMLVEKDSTIPILNKCSLDELFFYTKPGSSQKYISLCLQSNNKDDRFVVTVLEMDNSVSNGRVVVDINADNMIDITVFDNSDSIVLQKNLLDLPFDAFFDER